ncbi:hypothetical protein [uncultured Ferrovibrio sp.]|jgi:hypothetical protein|uniref:hypothetical protein n=1 Tax=uncultured Ferrovibrio sp. TaxID=1576913 RepID=UPI0026041CD1|nr:hypothetical protein [uncultured Ferrovibrio sp.]
MTKPPTQTRPADRWAADEIVAPELIALKALYDQARGERRMLAYADLPPVETLPGVTDLAIVKVGQEAGRYIYLAAGEGYHETAKVGGGEGLVPGPDGVTLERRPVIRQHFDLAVTERRPFHISITRWDGPKILQYDRLILPLDDGQSGPLDGDGCGEVTHLLVGEVFLRLAKSG